MKEMCKIYKRINVIILSLLLSLSLFPVTASARDRVDVDRTGSITLSYPIEGTEFRLYRVGDFTSGGELVLLEEYSKYPISLEQEDQDGWQTLATTVDGYITADHITPTETKKADAKGQVAFETGALGVYLVTWDTHVTNGKIYEAQPFFITLPSLNEEDESWIYDVTPKVKYTTSDLKTIDIHVHKAWNDQKNAQKKRPDKINVQLLCDGEVWENVELTAANSWNYDWTGLEKGHDWKVTEQDVPSGYTVKVTKEGDTFVITNTLPGTLKKPTSSRLPQTGMLWWPVPVLAALGLFFFLIGWLCRKRATDREL